MEEREIEYEDWVEKFKPTMDPGNNMDSPLDIGWRDHRTVTTEEWGTALREGRVWTLVDCGPYPLVVSGAHYVNRMEYYICEVPVEEGISYSEKIDPDYIENEEE
jgi:hypothetical protein